MINYTLDELVLIDEIQYSGLIYGYPGVAVDAAQGVFTQQTIDDMLAKISADEHPHFRAKIETLAADLATLGQIQTPTAFTADETAQMDFILSRHHGDEIGTLVHNAERVGFWSDVKLAKLEQSATYLAYYHIEPHSQAAIVGLVNDLIAGNQILHHG